ncbi:tetratricopeptide repeat protein, partial [Halioglobus sp.]|nr:tetratricopeptide repeat protein [Halioglobus sp.]
GDGPFAAAYAAAEGDVLLAAGRNNEARMAYQKSLAMGGIEGSASSSVSQKLQSLMPAAVLNDVLVAAEAADETDNQPGQEE